VGLLGPAGPGGVGLLGGSRERGLGVGVGRGVGVGLYRGGKGGVGVRWGARCGGEGDR